MAPVTNGRVLFNSVPTGYPEPGKTTVYDTSETIDIKEVPLNGGFLIKTLELSIEPFMRGLMRAPEAKSYGPPYILGEPLSGFGIAVVLRSELSTVKAGDHIYGFLSHQNYDIKHSLDYIGVLENTLNLPWSCYLGAAGIPGKTAYMGWKEYSHAKKKGTAFITTGAGSVGSMVIQLAKQDGMKVIASAGSAEKVQFMKECGADVAFDYKTTSTKEILEKESPIDVYWDNVGGEVLDLALDAANIGARFIECGMMSGYNTGDVSIKNLSQVITKSITMQGFRVKNLYSKYSSEFDDIIPAQLARGELKYQEDVWTGLDKVGEAVLAVQSGMNKGKAVVHVADE